MPSSVFNWMLQTLPGSSYAVATAMMVFGLLKIATTTQRSALLWAASGLVAAIAALRAQLFIVMALAWIPLFLAAWQPRQKWLRPAAAMAIVVIGLIGVIGAEYISLAPHFISGHNNAVGFFQLIHGLELRTYPHFLLQFTWRVLRQEGFTCVYRLRSRKTAGISE